MRLALIQVNACARQSTSGTHTHIYTFCQKAARIFSFHTNSRRRRQTRRALWWRRAQPFYRCSCVAFSVINANKNSKQMKRLRMAGQLAAGVAIKRRCVQRSSWSGVSSANIIAILVNLMRLIIIIRGAYLIIIRSSHGTNIMGLCVIVISVGFWLLKR